MTDKPVKKGAASKKSDTTEAVATQDPLAAETLMKHVRALAKDIGPRPAGSSEEEQAREYIRTTLAEMGMTEVDQIPFQTPNSAGYTLIPITALALLGTLIGRSGRPGAFIGGLANLAAAAAFWWFAGMRKMPYTLPIGQHQSATLVTRIPPAGERRRRLVLIGHTDSNKHRLFFTPALKKSLLAGANFVLSMMLINGLVHLIRTVGPKHALKGLYRTGVATLIADLTLLLADERADFIEGANDNATAVACLLSLAAHLKEHPLKQTEVWLAFTGAEEVGCLGMHALLDSYGDELHDAWFLDFEMVGAGDLIYITRHTGISFLNSYKPDPHSLALAEKTAIRHPELRITGRDMVIMEEIGALRNRDYRGICLASVGRDGFLVNWHQYSDIAENIEPETLERAARFAWAMMQSLDE